MFLMLKVKKCLLGEWEVLRKKHRIIGDIIGSYNVIPMLPQKLLPEEVYLLILKKIGKVCSLRKNSVPISDDFERNLIESEQKVYKQIREKQLKSIIDSIVEQKRKKGDTRTNEDIFSDELEKSSKINSNQMIWPLLLQSDTVTYDEIDYDPLQRTSLLKCKVFCDLWEKGYYITGGSKFGGDYLVYKGDPLLYHALFIVKCMDVDKEILPREIVTFGRLGNSVKKKSVFASYVENVVSYISVSWIDENF